MDLARDVAQYSGSGVEWGGGGTVGGCIRVKRSVYKPRPKKVKVKHEVNSRCELKSFNPILQTLTNHSNFTDPI